MVSRSIAMLFAVLACTCAPEDRTRGANLEAAATPARPEALAVAALPGRRAAVSSASVPVPTPERFAAWNEQLRTYAPGRDVVLLDLDAVDENIDRVRARLDSRYAIRVVTKSLPSADLVRYVLDRLGTRRVMAFSEGVLSGLFDELRGLDVLLGRPMPVEAAERVIAAHPAEGKQVAWLVDTKERMLSYAGLAARLHHRLDVAIELDVGLRRGGAGTTAELLEMLSVVASQPHRLRFTGFMGYDGHVPYAPDGFDPNAEFAAVQSRYDEFVRAGSDAYPRLFSGARIYDSGGTRTYERYTKDLTTPVNEVALGSGFVAPASFGELAALGHQAATFFASPILKKIDPAELPFAPGYLPELAKTNPSFEVAFFMLAGGFPGDIVAPQGLILNPYIDQGGGLTSLLPNQSLRNDSRQVPLGIGEFVFHHAWEGDGLVWLDAVELLRNDRLVGRWKTMREGCAGGCRRARF